MTSSSPDPNADSRLACSSQFKDGSKIERSLVAAPPPAMRLRFARHLLSSREPLPIRMSR